MDRWARFILRANGPFSFRFLLQPSVALFLGIRAGLRDARKGSPPYLGALFKHPEMRGEPIRNGWKDIVRLFILAVILDVLVQWFMFRWIYSGGALVIAFFLAVPLYVLIRGPTARIIRKLSH